MKLNKRIMWMTGIIIALLTLPFIATQLSEDIHWSGADYIMMGMLLLFIALLYEFITRKSEKMVYKVGFGLGLLGAFLLFWVNGAVGLIGSEGQAANFLYGLVFLVGLTGSLISRFTAKGMAITMFITAVVQFLIPVVAFLIWPPPGTSWSPGVFGVFWLNGFFVMLFVVSGFLFRRAAEHEA